MNDNIEVEIDNQVICCEFCGGVGLISYNPNLNPTEFPGHAIAKCVRCKGTGIAPVQQ